MSVTTRFPTPLLGRIPAAERAIQGHFSPMAADGTTACSTPNTPGSPRSRVSHSTCYNLHLGLLGVSLSVEPKRPLSRSGENSRQCGWVERTHSSRKTLHRMSFPLRVLALHLSFEGGEWQNEVGKLVTERKAPSNVAICPAILMPTAPSLW